MTGSFSSLDVRIRRVLAQLEIRLHYGSTTTFDKDGSGPPGKVTGGNRPPGEHYPPHDRYRAEYVACADDACRARVCEEAEAELEALTSFKATRVENAKSERDWILEDADPHAAGRRFGWAESRVRRLLVANDRDPDTGKPLAGVLSEDERERVQQLAGKCSLRQIAMFTGLSKSTVDRVLKEAA